MAAAASTIGALVPALLLWGTAVWAAPAQSALADESSLGRLDLLVRAGRAFRDRRFDEAVALYRSAWAIAPDDGQPLVMAGVAAFQTRDPARAEQNLRSALTHRLSPEDQELAHTYLTLIGDLRAEAPGTTPPTAPEAAAWSPSVITSLGGGYDSNAGRVPSRGIDTDLSGSTPASRSLFAAAGIQLAMARPLGRRLEVELRYEVDQRTHADRTLDDLDFLDQEAAVELSWRLGSSGRLSLAAAGQLSFYGGATELRPFSRSLRLDPQLTLGHGPLRLRLGLSGQASSTLDPQLAYLSGRRLEASAAPSLAIGGWLASLTARVRQEALGTARVDLGSDGDPVCPLCRSTAVVPYSNRSIGASLRLGSPLRWPLRPALTGRWESRSYDRPARTEVRSPGLVEQRDVRYRRDQRLAVGASLSTRLRAATVTVRYEDSTLSSTFTGQPAGGYRKQTLSLDLSIDWL